MFTWHILTWMERERSWILTTKCWIPPFQFNAVFNVADTWVQWKCSTSTIALRCWITGADVFNTHVHVWRRVYVMMTGSEGVFIDDAALGLGVQFACFDVVCGRITWSWRIGRWRALDILFPFLRENIEVDLGAQLVHEVVVRITIVGSAKPKQSVTSCGRLELVWNLNHEVLFAIPVDQSTIAGFQHRVTTGLTKGMCEALIMIALRSFSTARVKFLGDLVDIKVTSVKIKLILNLLWLAKCWTHTNVTRPFSTASSEVVYLRVFIVTRYKLEDTKFLLDGVLQWIPSQRTPLYDKHHGGSLAFLCYFTITEPF